ncbi:MULTISPECIES: hypothetical protein [Pseudoalteromonas]|nr:MULTISPECIES: hypothetical protein [Pseudoalteromonas]
MKLALKKQQLKKLSSKEMLDKNATKAIGGGGFSLSGCFKDHPCEPY